MIAIAAGETFSLALTEKGEAVSWGKPAAPSKEGMKAIVAGAKFTAGIEEDGTVVVWGEGTGNVTGKGKMLAAGNDHLLVLRENGRVETWGDNSRGQCEVPKDLPEIAKVFAGAYGSAAVDPEGKVYFWGEAVDLSNRKIEVVREISIGRAEVVIMKDSRSSPPTSASDE